MRQFDPIVKYILDRFGNDFTILHFDEPGLQIVQRLDTQQSNIKVYQNDMTFEVRRRNGEVFLQHIEIQTQDSTDIPMHLRVLGYASALVVRYQMPVYSMVLYLSPGAGLRDPGGYSYGDDSLGLRLNYKVVRLSELEGASFLESDAVGLLPFMPLMQPPAGMSPDAWVEACVSKTYDAPVDSETRSTLLFATSLLGSLAHAPELFQKLISEEIMQESPFYDIVLQRGVERGIQQGIERGIQQGIEQGIERGIQQGIERGIERGARENAVKNILTVLNTRFPESDIPQADTALQEIISRERLDQILNTALTADTFTDFLKALHP